MRLLSAIVSLVLVMRCLFTDILISRKILYYRLFIDFFDKELFYFYQSFAPLEKFLSYVEITRKRRKQRAYHFSNRLYWVYNEFKYKTNFYS